MWKFQFFTEEKQNEIVLRHSLSFKNFHGKCLLLSCSSSGADGAASLQFPLLYLIALLQYSARSVALRPTLGY